VEQRLSMGFFRRLLTPQDEEDFVDGLKAYVKGDKPAALELFQKSLHIADAAFMAGFTALKEGRFRQAVAAFLEADRNHGKLGDYFRKYGISISLSMPITPEITAHIAPTRRGLLLGLVEAYQELGENARAVEVLERLRRSAPEDAAVKLSLAELLIEAFPGDAEIYDRVVRIAKDVENESSIHAALMLYKGKALEGLEMYTSARDTLTAACRRKKDRSEELLRAVRYERALVYRKMGRKSRARSELEKLYSEDPDYRDVAEMLGVAGRGRS
jgi:tetratricopeptide (TPR) repeat protein